jgi:hypothetical protein
VVVAVGVHVCGHVSFVTRAAKHLNVLAVCVSGRTTAGLYSTDGSLSCNFRLVSIIRMK